MAWWRTGDEPLPDPEVDISLMHTHLNWPQWVDLRFSIHNYSWLSNISTVLINHITDDVIKWKRCPRYWPFVWGIHRSPVNSPHKGQWRVALMFSLICVWIYGWVNIREAGDLRRYLAHYDVIAMLCFLFYLIIIYFLWNLFDRTSALQWWHIVPWCVSDDR